MEIVVKELLMLNLPFKEIIYLLSIDNFEKVYIFWTGFVSEIFIGSYWPGIFWFYHYIMKPNKYQRLMSMIVFFFSVPFVWKEALDYI